MIRATGIAKSFGGLTVLRDISLEVGRGERRGLIGPNGAGKTTFLNILSGIERPTAGQVHLGAQDITSLPPHQRARLGVGRTFQIGNLFESSTVRHNIVLALLAGRGKVLRFGSALSRDPELHADADDLIKRWELEKLADVRVSELSYGQRRIIEIVLALAGRPTLLLLDEPAAGLSGAETQSIIETVSSLDPDLSILLVEHDMELVFSICDRVTVIAEGHVLAEGEGDSVRNNPAVIEAYLGMPL